MTLMVRTVDIVGATGYTALHAFVRERLDKALGRVRARPHSARVTFFDDNGPKGGVAWRCAVTVQVPDRPVLRVECTATTPGTAFDAAVTRVDRQLRRLRERARDERRHPKKYFAAAQVATETPSRRRGRAVTGPERPGSARSA